MIGVIALLARPKFLPAVVANFERQSHPDKLLVIVENGPGVGASADVRLPANARVIRSKADRSHARNAGYAHLRTLGVDHWALFEDDDLYGAGYLAEYWENRELGDVLGKGSFWLRGPDGSHHRLFSGNEWGELGLKFEFVWGGMAAATLFGKTARALDWEPGVQRCEELIWYTDMLRAGRKLCTTSDAHFVRRRFDDASHAHATPGEWRREVTGPHAREVPIEKIPAWLRELTREPVRSTEISSPGCIELT